MPARQQLVDQMSADEPRSPGDQDAPGPGKIGQLRFGRGDDEDDAHQTGGEGEAPGCAAR
jgi:hypothetical protein